MNWISLLLAFTMVGCSQSQKKMDVLEESKTQEETMKAFEHANTVFDSQQFGEAAKLYDQLLLKHPANDLDTLVTFNAGLAHMQNNDCTTAGERFRKVIRMGKKGMPALASRAMLRMSDVYVCLGEDNKAIFNLIEIRKNKHDLPDEILSAEIPAKLAAAYARNGNQKEAEKYFRAAEKALIKIQSSIPDTSKQKEMLAKTLFLMGSVSQLNTKTMSSEDYFLTIRAMQKYLYHAVEFNDKIWSSQASDQLDLAYRNTWEFLDRVPTPSATEPILAEREQTRSKLLIAEQALLALKSLYMVRIPAPDEPSIISQLMAKMKGHETKIRSYVATHIVGTSLTPEALQAEGMKRAGRVLNPDPLLEQQAIKKQADKAHVKAKPKKK